MTTLMIKDLETSKELTRRELSAIRGGDNGSIIGGLLFQSAGPNFFSPMTVVSTPIVTQTDVHPVVNVDLNLANILGSMNTGVGQIA